MSAPSSLISAQVGVSDGDRLAACIAAAGGLGARVQIRAGGDNCVRITGPRAQIVAFCPPAPAPIDPHAFPSAPGVPSASPVALGVALIEAEGLPNLLHELVHVVLAGRLDDDHGFDYNAIPMELEREPARRVLWDELACCVVSCAYLLPTAAVEGAAWLRACEWFHEQISIQPFFYGMESDMPAFRRAVESLWAGHRAEFEMMLEAAYDRMGHILAWAGAPPHVAHSPRLGLAPLWHSPAPAGPPP